MSGAGKWGLNVGGSATRDEQHYHNCLDFVNRKLGSIGEGPVTDLATCFADGMLLAKLIEAMTGKVIKMNRMVAITSVKLDNIGKCLRAMDRMGIGWAKNIAAYDFYSGNVKAITSFLVIQTRYFDTAPPPPGSEAKKQSALERAKELRAAEEAGEDPEEKRKQREAAAAAAATAAAAAVTAAAVVGSRSSGGVPAPPSQAPSSGMAHMERLAQLRSSSSAPAAPAAPAGIASEIAAAEEAQGSMQLAMTMAGGRAGSTGQNAISAMNGLVAAAEKSQDRNLSELQKEQLARLCDNASKSAGEVLAKLEALGSSAAEVSAAKEAVSTTNKAAAMIKAKAGFSEQKHHKKYGGLWKRAGMASMLAADLSTRRKKQSWAVTNAEAQEFAGAHARVHHDDMALLLKLQSMTPQEQEAYMQMLDQQDIAAKHEAEENATRELMMRGSFNSAEPAVERHEAPVLEGRWEVIYEGGITYRCTADWDDRLPDSIAPAALGEQFDNPETVTGDDGVVYIQGTNGFWIPTTTKDKKTVVVRELMANNQPAPPRTTAPGTKEPALPAGWAKFQDPSSGVDYYVNPATGVTQWELPEGSSEANHHVDPQEAPTSGVQPEHEKEERDVRFLMDMGFGTEDQSRRMLHKSGMNVDKAVEKFLAGEQA